MFITKKRHNLIVERLLDELRNSDTEIHLTYEELDVANLKVRKLTTALEDILANRTAGANATVTRMANIASKALGRAIPVTPAAEFISEEPKEINLGTLADIGRSLRAPTLNTTEGRVLASSDQIVLFPAYIPTDDIIGTDSSTIAPTITTDFGGYAGGGSSFDGGGSSGSWSSDSSSSSSSYDSGSSYSDSGSCGGGSCD